MVAYDTLANFMKNNFTLWHHHKWAMDVIEAMMPWERHVNIDMLQAYLAQKELERKEMEAAARVAAVNRKR
jgi:hypothetical protein